MPDPNKNQDNFIPVAPKYEDGPVLIQFPSAKLPIFWGPGQLLDETTLAYVVPIGWHDFEPLKIPRVGRMIYGGKAETESEDYAPQTPDSPPPPPPPNTITCSWTYSFTPESRAYFFKYDSAQAGFYISFFSEHCPPIPTAVAIENPSYGAGASRYDLTTWQNSTIQVTDSGGNVVFTGSPVGCPYLFFQAAKTISWVYKCSSNPNLVVDSFAVVRRAFNTTVGTFAPQCWVATTPPGAYFSEVPIQHHEEYGCGPYPEV